MTVFACLLVCDGMESPYGSVNPGKILRDFIPNDTQVWQRWRNKVTLQMKEGKVSSESWSHLELDQDDWSLLAESDIKLLTTLLNDAKSAFEGYHEYFASS